MRPRSRASRAWLGLRRSVLFPRLPARAERGSLLGERALEASWRLADGARLARRRESGRRRAARHRKAPGEPLACTSERRARTRRCRHGTCAGRWSADERAGRPARDLSVAAEPQLRFSGRGRSRSVPRAARRESLLLLAVLEDAARQRARLRRHGSLEAEPRARRARGLRRALRATRGARHGPDRRRRAEPHRDHGRRRSLVAQRARARPSVALRRLFRHRLAPGDAEAQGQGAGARARRSIRQRAARGRSRARSSTKRGAKSVCATSSIGFRSTRRRTRASSIQAATRCRRAAARSARRPSRSRA